MKRQEIRMLIANWFVSLASRIVGRQADRKGRLLLANRLTELRGNVRPRKNLRRGNYGIIEALESRELLTTITVTTNLDVVDPNDQFVSLREAVATANSDPGADTIAFSAAANGTFVLSSGALVVTDTLTIQGNGRDQTQLDARNASRVIEFTGATGDLTLDGLSILNGNSENDSGGGIEFESSGALTVSHSLLTGNNSGSYGGSINSGGGSVTLIDSIASGNHANIGGGLNASSGAITLVNSTVSGNSTNNGGGGIYSNNSTIALTGSTVSGNTASYGGGILDYTGSITLTNSTLSGNYAGGAGGGILAVYSTVTLINSTVAFNTAYNATNGGGGVFLGQLSASLIAENSIIAQNLPGNGVAPDVRSANGGSVTLTNSLIGDKSGTTLIASATPDGNGNLIGGAAGLAIDPLFGPLANNGGPTQTHALLVNSPAIDRGSNGTAAGLTTDQRGLPRVSGVAMDMGAYEVQLPVVNFSVATISAKENSGTVNVTVTLSQPFGADVTIPFTVGGTASDPAKYTIDASPLVIPAGQTSGTIAVHLVDSDNLEPAETVVLTLGSVVNGVAGTVTSTTLTIKDKNLVPTVTFSAATGSAAEDSGTYNVTVNLSDTVDVPVTIPFTVGGTASNPDNFTIDASPLIIPAGQTSGTITVHLVDTASVQPAETVSLTLGNLTNATPGDITSTTLNIIDVTALPTVSFAASSVSDPENAGTISLVVNLSAASPLDTTIPFSVGGTATDPSDYTIATSPLVIPAGMTSGVITLQLVNTVGYEPTESTVVTLGTPTNATVGATAAETVTILDLDAFPLVSFDTTTSEVSETAGSLSLNVHLSAPSALSTTIPFSVGAGSTAIDPDHYTLDASPLIIPAGQTTGTIRLHLVDTVGIEPAQTVILNLDTPTNGTLGITTSSTVTIIDSEIVPIVNFQATEQTVSEGIGLVSVVVKLSSVAVQDVTIPYSVTGTATDPADFTINTSPLVIPAGQSSGTITISVVDDQLVEDDETMILTLGTPTNAALGVSSVDTLTIRDNDFIPTVSFSVASQNANEADGTALLTVNLSAASQSNVTIPFSVLGGTASSPGDYSLSSSPLIIPAGQTSGSIVLNLVNDSLIEGNETVVVALGVPTNGALGATTSETVTIVDNDFNTAPTLAAGQVVSVSENSADGTVVGQVIATDTDSPAPYNTLTFSLASNPGNLFVISPSGQITVANNAVLDFETTPSVTLAVTVTDGGSPALSVTQNVVVNLVNVVEPTVLSGGSGTVQYNKSQPAVKLLPDLAIAAGEGPTSLQRIVISYFVQKHGSLADFNLGNASSLGTVQVSGATDFRKAGGIHTVTITLSSGITDAEVQAFLRGITFSTKKLDPKKGATLGRKIDVQVFDRHGEGNPSNVVSTNIVAKVVKKSR
jgi:5-hydroxyisourate hydrolase-like protein (transthyretin family)